MLKKRYHFLRYPGTHLPAEGELLTSSDLISKMKLSIDLGFFVCFRSMLVAPQALFQFGARFGRRVPKPCPRVLCVCPGYVVSRAKVSLVCHGRNC